MLFPYKALLLATTLFGISLLAPVAARADSTQTYNFSGTLANSFNGDDMVTGTFTLDFTTTSMTAYNFNTPFGVITSTAYPTTNYTETTYTFTQIIPPYGDYVLFLFEGPTISADSMSLYFATPFSPFNGSSLFTGIPMGISTPEDGASSFVQCANFMTPVPSTCPLSDGISSFTCGSATATSPMPEPSSLALLAGGLFGLGALATRKRLT